MLGSLRGIVSGRLDQRILIEVDAVGYWVHTGSWQPSGEVHCYLYHHVREDINQLFGFESLETLALFEQLISISGIGPKAALAVLSLGDSARIAQAITTSDLAFLSLAPGVGKRAAEKIVLELKGKMGNFATSTGIASPTEDLVGALESLGYKRAELLPIIGKLPDDLADIGAQIKWVLSQVVT